MRSMVEGFPSASVSTPRLERPGTPPPFASRTVPLPLRGRMRAWRSARAFAQSDTAVADAQVSLFKALGGGWENAGPVARP